MFHTSKRQTCLYSNTRPQSEYICVCIYVTLNVFPMMISFCARTDAASNIAFIHQETFPQSRHRKSEQCQVCESHRSDIVTAKFNLGFIKKLFIDGTCSERPVHLYSFCPYLLCWIRHMVVSVPSPAKFEHCCHSSTWHGFKLRP